MTNIIKMPKRFDYSASGEFNTAVTTALISADENKQVILDCMHMDFIDSAGIGLLVMAHKKAQSHDFSITVINAKSSIKEVFLLANLQKLIDIQ